MVEFIKAIVDDRDGDLTGRVLGLYGFLAVLNLSAWAAALILFHGNLLLLGTAFLAYSFGLRHAVDADHIAAIDNATRKLMQEGKRPVAVGFFFSLGHSTIVVALSLALAATAATLRQFQSFQSFGGLFGTAVSAGFLFALAIMNFFVLMGIWRTFRGVRRGAPYVDEDLNNLLARRGVFGRLFRGLFSLVRQSWYLYPIGILFGLGFDTATEVGLLGISATEASRGLNVWAIMIFPALFTAGMSLVDTTDGLLMLGAYRWSHVRPLRKLYYNLTVTTISVLVALAVGGLEVLNLLRGKWNLSGPFWNAVEAAGGHFGMLGYLIISLFAGCWIVSLLFYKLLGYDKIEADMPK
jgi:high-affinity nickel-transport protein